MFRQYATLAKKLLKAIGSTFYVCKDEILSYMDDLLDILKLFTADHVLTEHFARSILELVGNVYYSNFVRRMTTQHVVGFIDILLLIGWRNLYHVGDFNISSLEDWLGKKPFFQSRGGLAELSLSESGSQNWLQTHPGAEAGRRFQAEVDSRLGSGVGSGKKGTEAPAYFGFQKDENVIMHLTTENIVHFLLSLNKATQTEALAYLAKVMAIELRNEQSCIPQQSLVLLELAYWHCSSNLDRVSKDCKLEQRGKLWLLNEYLAVVLKV